MKITNKHDISLPMAVWLLNDEYDYQNIPNYISATSLLKSTKQIILSKRVDAGDTEIDVSDFISSRVGNAVHDAMERAWTTSGTRAMKMLGYPDHVAENIVVNPSEEAMTKNPNIIPIWIEQRAYKEINIDGVIYTIGGKFDQVIDGRLFDTKTTSVWTYIRGNKDDDYGKQGGIYKWLNPEKITSDEIYIQFVFTDWQRAMTRTNDKYPPVRVLEYPVTMPSEDEITFFIREKVKALSRLWDAPEEDLPECTDKELWRNEPSYKFFLDPEKAKDPNARSSKNCDTMAEALEYQAGKGGRGVIITKLGEPKACEYCPAFSVCKQKDAYFAERD